MKFTILFAFALIFIMAVVAEPGKPYRPNPAPVRPVRPRPAPRPHPRVRREYPVRGEDVSKYPEYDTVEARR